MLLLVCVEWLNLVLFSFFFFQAEDGIRDLTVTGVQTCALPILFFALDTLNRPYIVGSTLPREAVEPALVADTAAMVALGGDSAGTELGADMDGEHVIGLASPS